MLTLPQRRPVVHDAIMVGSRTCERADRKSQVSYATPRRGVTRIFAWGPRADLLRVTQLIHELFHVALSPITSGRRARARGGVADRSVPRAALRYVPNAHAYARVCGTYVRRRIYVFRFEKLIARDPSARGAEATAKARHARVRYSILNTG